MTTGFKMGDKVRVLPFEGTVGYVSSGSHIEVAPTDNESEHFCLPPDKLERIVDEPKLGSIVSLGGSRWIRQRPGWRYIYSDGTIAAYGDSVTFADVLSAYSGSDFVVIG